MTKPTRVELLQALRECITAIDDETSAAFDGEHTHPTIKKHAAIATRAEALLAREIGPLTIRKVNAEIKKRGGKAQLVHNTAQEYFYFVNVGKHGVPSQSICVSRLNVYTLEQWISEWQEAEKREIENSY